MQTEIDALDPETEVQILGVNGAGNESGNASITSGRTLPWLQDTPDVNVWGLWEVDYRDVVILDTDNQVFDVYNLTQHDLAVSENYEALLDLLLAAAQQ